MRPMDSTTTTTTPSSAPSPTSPSPPTTTTTTTSPSIPPPQPQPQAPEPPAATQTQTIARPQFQAPAPRPPLPRPRAPFSASPIPSPTSTPMQRGGMALGVPAQPRPPQPGGATMPFSSFGPNPSFGPSFGATRPDQTAQVRTSIQGIQTIGTVGSLSVGSLMRPSGIPAHHQTRPGQMALRSIPSASTQPVGPQKLQSQGLIRASSTTSLGSQLSGPLQNSQSPRQPWMPAQGKPSHGSPMTSQAYRPQVRPQQRAALPQQASHMQQQQLQSHQQQLQQKQQQQQQQTQALTKNPQTLSQSTLLSRAVGSTNQNTLLPSTLQSGSLQAGSASPADADDSCDHILSKRSIHELVAQVDPSEKLDPEVEDILVEIADDFVESITTVACSLAKHRKSTILEAKDILLHLERNWNMTLPGFGGDEIKYYKKPLTNEIHKDRLAAIKKSMTLVPELGNTKNITPGQAASNTKSHQAKAPVLGSPKLL